MISDLKQVCFAAILMALVGSFPAIAAPPGKVLVIVSAASTLALRELATGQNPYSPQVFGERLIETIRKYEASRR